MPLYLSSNTAMIRGGRFLTGFIVGSFFLAMQVIPAGAWQGAQKPQARGAASAPVQTAPKPSLDALKSRVSAFWDLLVHGQKLEAMQFVELSGRKNFDAWQLAQVSEPRITTLAFTPRPDEMAVTVEIRRIFPPFPTTFTWPVTQNWVFRNGNWFVRVEQTSAAGLFPTSPGQPKASLPSPQETEKRQKEIRAALHFDTFDLEFGRVNQGDLVPLSLGYKLVGNEPFMISLRNVPDDLVFRNIQNRSLPPGNDQKIQMELLTRIYTGEINEHFTAVISYQNVDVAYDFAIHGYVYVPVYAVPGALSFRSGERTKEIVVKNDSKSEVTLKMAANKDFDIAPLPQKLPAGASCTLKVSVIQDVAEKNRADTVSLNFDKPVENMGGLEISIVRNYEVLDPEKARELQLRDLVRKSGVPVKK